MRATLPYSLTTVKVIASEKSLLVICKIVRQFVKALTADDMHYLLNRDNLSQEIQLQFSQKQKLFSYIFFAFLKSKLNFKHFSERDEPHN